MVKKRIVLIFSVLFYAGMFFMTCTARALHEAKLPHVKVLNLEYELFIDEEGNQSFGAAFPKEWYREGELYKVSHVMVNDEYRTIARRVNDLELGLENEEYYQIKNGIGSGEPIIVGGLDNVVDGSEVYIVEEIQGK
ncbi:MAG: hypothetical protein K2O71_04305 [Lachnospiraceae bacterium]|nr:hypothetical protein [Lachnospiraceae bacterium]